MKYYFQACVTLDPQTIIYNNYTGVGKQMVNLCIVILKQYIYAVKCFALQKPNFAEFMCKLSTWYLVDKQIANDTNNLKLFYKKWKNIF